MRQDQAYGIRALVGARRTWLVLRLRKRLFAQSCRSDYLVPNRNLALSEPGAVQTEAAVCAFWPERAVGNISTRSNLSLGMLQ